MRQHDAVIILVVALASSCTPAVAAQKSDETRAIERQTRVLEDIRDELREFRRSCER